MNAPYRGKPWSYSIIGAIIAFMIFTLSLVYIMVNQKVEVLYPDYYERTLQYDEVQKRLSNGMKPENAISHQFSSQRDSLFFLFATKGTYSGNIALVKPDNAASDKEFSFVVENGNSIGIPIHDLRKGSWGVEIEWKNESESLLTRFKLTL